MVNNKIFEMLSFELFTTHLRGVGRVEDGRRKKKRSLGMFHVS